MRGFWNQISRFLHGRSAPVESLSIVFITLAAAACYGQAYANQGPLNPPRPGYTLRWLGTAAWKLDYQGKTILIDPFLSRKAPLVSPSGKPSSWQTDKDSIEFALRAAKIDHVEEIFVSHGHFDHLGDVPYLLKKFPTANVYGSSSTCIRVKASHATANCIDITRERDIRISDMHVRVIPSLHALMKPKRKATPKKSLHVKNVDSDSEAWIFYFQGHGINFLYQGTANFLENELAGLRPSVAVLAPVHADYIDGYQEKLIGSLQPRKILLNHFDKFLLPFSAGVIHLEGQAKTNKFIAGIKQVAKTAEVTVPRFFEEIRIID